MLLYDLLLLLHTDDDKLDANIASEYELRTIKKMSKSETACEICEDDPYNKVIMEYG